MNILVYGGCFNPVHQGHVLIIEEALKNKNYDLVLILPNKKGHFKNDEMVDDQDRLNMLDLAFKDIPQVIIDKYELNQEDLVFTYDYIVHLKNEYPDAQIDFLIGADQAKKLASWYKINDLRPLINFVIAKRPGYDLDDTKVLDNDLSALNSTSIRNNLSSTNLDEVDQYIKDHNLYLDSYIKNKMSPSRYQHSKNVAKLAYLVAKKHHMDPNKAYLAGMLHDVAKEFAKDKLYELTKDTNYELNDKIVHAFAGAEFVKEDLNINDEDVLDAIRWHTTGKKGMSDLAKLIYTADLVSYDREYPEVQYLRNLLFEDLEKGFREGFLLNQEVLRKKGLNVNKDIQELEEQLKGEL